MNSRPATAIGIGDPSVYLQQFSVPFDYPVHFIERLFDRETPVFAQVLARREPAKLPESTARPCTSPPVGNTRT